MSFSTCTQYWYPCPQNSLIPQLCHQEFWMSCGDDLGRTSEMGRRENRIPVLLRFFWVVRTAALAEGAVLSHSYTPVLTSTPFIDGKGQSRGNSGGTELCLAHKPLTNGDATNHTQQQCGITQTFWENRWFKATRAPFQRDIQNVAELSIWTRFWQVYFLLMWREGFPSDCFKCKYYSHKTHQTICKLWPLVKLAIFLRPLSTRCN